MRILVTGGAGYVGSACLRHRMIGDFAWAYGLGFTILHYFNAERRT